MPSPLLLPPSRKAEAIRTPVAPLIGSRLGLQAAGSRDAKSEKEAEAAAAELKESAAKYKAKAKEAERQLRDLKDRLAGVQAELVR
eukprot:1160224-Prorocentrum_minimum.AAC.1